MKECDSILLLLYDLVVIIITTVAWIEKDVPSAIYPCQYFHQN